jgi:hypothetical protein
MKKALLVLGFAVVCTSLTPVFAAPAGGPAGDPAGGHGDPNVAGGPRFEQGFRAPAPRVGRHHSSGIAIYTGFPRRNYWREPCDCRVGWCDRYYGYYPYDGFYEPYYRPYAPVSGAGFYINF